MKHSPTAYFLMRARILDIEKTYYLISRLHSKLKTFFNFHYPQTSQAMPCLSCDFMF